MDAGCGVRAESVRAAGRVLQRGDGGVQEVHGDAMCSGKRLGRDWNVFAELMRACRAVLQCRDRCVSDDGANVVCAGRT